MITTVQARLDEETQAALDRLVHQLGMRPSEVVREGIRVLSRQHPARLRPKLVGVGLFDSGIPDLATNKRHLEGLGVKSMGPGWRSPDESIPE